MKRSLVLFPLAALLALAALAPGARPRTASAAVPDDGAPGEVERLRAHFARVQRELAARDLSALTAEQRAARARSVQALREYAAAGVFPHNHHFGEARPFFVDDHGTLCAMAYLIARSGREDLVRKVAASRNNAYVRELADDPALVAWLEENGLTAHEAGRIQPFYGPPPPPPAEPEEVSGAYVAGSVAVNAVNGLAMYLNAGPAPSAESARWRGGLGVTAGAAGMALGIAGLNQNDTYRAWSAVDLLVGALSTTLGIKTLITGDGSGAEARLRLAPNENIVLAATPVVSPGGTGVHFNLRF